MPQDQDDIKGADAMKQAPTPGPLSGDDDMKLLIAHTIIEDLRVQHPGIEQIDNERGDIWLPGGSTPQSSGCIVDIHSVAQAVEAEVRASLAPTAPVEASGSERVVGTIAHVSNGRSELPELIAAALRPQPSGETREAVEALEFYADGFDWHPGDGEAPDATHSGSPPTYYEASAKDELIEDAGKRARAALALIRPAPVASGGQHSSGEGLRLDRLRDWINREVPAGTESATWWVRQIDAALTRANPLPDDLRTACQAALDDYQTSNAHHPDHVLIRRTDFERIKALVEAPVSTRAEALSELAAMDGETMDLPPVASGGQHSSGEAAFDMVETVAAKVGTGETRRIYIDRAEGRVYETAPVAETAGEAFQPRVHQWLLDCFGWEIAGDRQERGDRLLEEVLELLQSGGYDPARVAALRYYVWGRPVGEPAQEVGGVMVTLAAYCVAHDLDMMGAGETELARIVQPEIVQKIRAKQAAKPTGSALPIAVPAQDDDKLRIAVEALEPFSEAARMAEISGRPPFEFCDASDYQRAASTSVRLKTEVQP